MKIENSRLIECIESSIQDYNNQLYKQPKKLKRKI